MNTQLTWHVRFWNPTGRDHVPAEHRAGGGGNHVVNQVRDDAVHEAVLLGRVIEPALPGGTSISHV
jgi:hypothetical protein